MVPNPLPFKLHDFTRLMWASQRARDVWEPRISKFASAWTILERLAVLHRLEGRSVTLQNCTPSELPELTVWAVQHGLIVLPLQLVADTGAYMTGTTDPVAGKPTLYRIALLRSEDANVWLKAWKLQHNEILGRMLGFPPCCREFFDRTWAQGQVDTTWDMATNSGISFDGDVLDGNRYANILLRWLGVRLVSHLPCSFHCQRTVDIASAYATLGRTAGFEQEMQWAEEMLDWPVQWTALHGIAEIKTPIVKISTRTDATSARLTVNRHGNGYPVDGVTGLGFPFRQTDVVPLTLRLHGTLAELLK